MIIWISNNLTMDSVNSEEPDANNEDLMIKFGKFTQNINFKFEYLFSIMIACLIVKLMELILFSSEIGPLV